MKPEMNDSHSTRGNGNGGSAIPIGPTRWTALTGRWSFDSGVSVYEGPLEDQQQQYGLALTELRLGDGRARVTITFDNVSDLSVNVSAGIVLGFHSETGSYLNPQ